MARGAQPRDLQAAVALLWGEQEQPTRGPKPSLDPRRIAEAAVAVADAEGLDAVSMNKVAAAFGVSAMALYRYVPSKAELVELMVEAVCAERPDLSGAGDDWRAQVTEWARRHLEVFQQHPWLLAATAMRRQAMGPNQLGWMDTALAALRPSGLTAAHQHRIFLLVVGLVRNLVQQSSDYDEEHEREWNRLNGELLARHADRFPALTDAIAAGAFAPPADDPLEFGVACILDGAQALIERQQR
ncbi:TetR/AcrR family transcriptional regulator [Cryptosporangium aurantiacum]|uniref:Transcriptional regulator, TetR family n=1 Tax=Cryptosporangium aurantiacum TaxID=134849 RepID=A0A1M7RM48_9ACTN|nr:TetR/AcrR family transcriptional regulator [Cryptosporangium aurantiacum]SHN47250.1 transcriptional regulator, TetR family [Cryptosporangium aurantiacum]